MKAELTSVSIVALGHFSPNDFVLDKLRETDAIPVSELDESSYEVLVPGEAVVLRFPWGKLDVLRERLVVETSQVPYVRILDLAQKLIREHSPQSTVSKFGMNVHSHFDLHDAKARDALAMKLVPASNWGEFGKDVMQTFNEVDDKHGGLMRVTMRQAVPNNRQAGWLDITVEPSGLLKGSGGVSVQANDHFQPSVDELTALRGNAQAVSAMLMDTMAANFDRSIERSMVIGESLVKPL